VKEDDADRKKRRASIEKQKSVKDAEKKKEKKKNLERQALEERRAKSRHGGESEEDSPDEDDENDDDDDGDDFEGMAARLDQILQDLLQTDVATLRAGPPRGHKVSLTTGARRRRPLATHTPTRPLIPPGGNPIQRLVQATGSKPLRRGR